MSDPTEHGVPCCTAMGEEMIPSSIPGWEDLDSELAQRYMQALKKCLCAQQEAGVTIYPPANFCRQPAKESIFKAFELTQLSDVRVVILGQDPYPKAGLATGLAFAVPNDIPTLPASLRNIDIELKHKRKAKNDLVKWAEQGVLLLNTTLTVKDGIPGSHRHLGWDEFTDRVLKLVDQEKRDIVFCLWGEHARKKKALLSNTKDKRMSRSPWNFVAAMLAAARGRGRDRARPRRPAAGA